MRLAEFNAAIETIANATEGDEFRLELTLTTGQIVTGEIFYARAKSPEGKVIGECIEVGQTDAPTIFISLQHVVCLRIAD